MTEVGKFAKLGRKIWQICQLSSTELPIVLNLNLNCQQFKTNSHRFIQLERFVSTERLSLEIGIIVVCGTVSTERLR